MSDAPVTIEFNEFGKLVASEAQDLPFNARYTRTDTIPALEAAAEARGREKGIREAIEWLKYTRHGGRYLSGMKKALLDADAPAQPKPDAGREAFTALVREGIAEAEKAMRKFPQPNYVISKFAEESGEVVKAAIHCAEGRETRENVLGEIRQTIAMIYRLWAEGDQVHGLRALAEGDSHE